MEYKLVVKPPFTIYGVSRQFNTDNSHQEIPKYWKEIMETKSVSMLGMHGVCMDLDGKDFEYMIADSYIPSKEVPDYCFTKVIPASTWAVFPCTLGTLQSTNDKMWATWLSNNPNFQLAYNLNIECYSPPDENLSETYCEI